MGIHLRGHKCQNISSKDIAGIGALFPARVEGIAVNSALDSVFPQSNRPLASNKNRKARRRSQALLRRREDDIEAPIVHLYIFRCERAHRVKNNLSLQ